MYHNFFFFRKHSITTRIKTSDYAFPEGGLVLFRKHSITTRIKTKLKKNNCLRFFSFENIPLQQGLKL